MSNSKPINLYAKALDFLSRRDYSYRELFTKLQKYTDDTEAVKEILTQMVEQKYLNEERYIENYINAKSQKFGAQRIKYQLMNKVADQELVNNIYQQAAIDEFAIAKSIWLRKFHGKQPENTKEKAQQIRFMTARGFSLDTIFDIIKSAKDEDLE
ncbi:MAG TPA: regulatory protein RecX [Burkholderiales bacterium]|nr:regulatory protein RecX [Burkholderiales bacterium]